MAQVKSVIEIFDPTLKERKKLKEVATEKEFQLAAKNLIATLFARNANAGKKGDERFLVYGVHRDKGIHRRFNLAMMIVQNNQIREVNIGTGVTQDTLLVQPEREYGGALNHAEMLLAGDWCVASIDEEASLKAKDDAETKAANAAAEKRQSGNASAIEELARALVGSNQPKLATK